MEGTLFFVATMCSQSVRHLHAPVVADSPADIEQQRITCNAVYGSHNMALIFSL